MDYINEGRFINKCINLRFNQDNQRTRINQNLLKVKQESKNVKSLLSLGVQSSLPKTETRSTSSTSPVIDDICYNSRRTSRKDLLRTCILLATSRNTQAQENLINVIRIRLDKIKEKDYKYIADLIYLKDPIIVEKVNAFLCFNLEGYMELHKKFYKHYYTF